MRRPLETPFASPSRRHELLQLEPHADHGPGRRHRLALVRLGGCAGGGGARPTVAAAAGQPSRLGGLTLTLSLTLTLTLTLTRYEVSREMDLDSKEVMKGQLP